MAENGTGGGTFHKNIINSTNCNLVIGDGNIVNVWCRRKLHYAERSTTTSRSNRRSAVQDGGECCGKNQTKLRFRQRKSTQERKAVSSESEEDMTMSSAPKVFPAFSEETGRKVEESLSKSLVVLNKLHPLRDNGNWEQFFKVADERLLETQDDLTMKVLITLEKSVVVSYQNNLEKAEAMVLEALQSLEKSKLKDAVNYHFLVALAHIHLTGFYRRQDKHGKAQHVIAIAEQNSKSLNSRFLKALIYYEMASNMTKYISSIKNCPAREELVAQAKCFMKQCISLCVELDDGRVYIRKHHFGLLKLALMHLNCRTRVARGQITSVECIREAENCLKTVSEKYEAQMSEGQKIQLLIARSDLSYRQQNFQGARVTCLEALNLAEKRSFSLEIRGIRERLVDISRVITSQELNTEIPLSQEHCPDSLSSSTSPSRRNSPFSSACEMEVD